MQWVRVLVLGLVLVLVLAAAVRLSPMLAPRRVRWFQLMGIMSDRARCKVLGALGGPPCMVAWGPGAMTPSEPVVGLGPDKAPTVAHIPVVRCPRRPAWRAFSEAGGRP